MVAAALIDRLVHHATMATPKGKSSRLRERGGGVAPAPDPPLRGSLERRNQPHGGALLAPDGGAVFGAPRHGRHQLGYLALQHRKSAPTGGGEPLGE